MIKVLINLKIPSLTLKGDGSEAPKRLDNSGIRLLKPVEVEALPKVGDVLEMAVHSGLAPFGCRVTRSDWDDRENLFVVSCAFAKTSIPEPLYRTLMDSPDWTVKSLV
ncbi:MAG: hypothetical protein AB7I13_18500 [Vicinamibacterales bacterium]